MAEPAAAESAPPPEGAADTAEGEQSNAAPAGEEPAEAASKQEAVEENGAAVGEEPPPDAGGEAPAEEGQESGGGGEGGGEEKEEEAPVTGGGEAAAAAVEEAAAEEAAAEKQEDKDKEQDSAADIAPQEAAADPASESPPADAAEPAAEAAEPAAQAADGAQEAAAAQEAPAAGDPSTVGPESTEAPAVAAEEAAAPASTTEPEALADAAVEEPAPASAEPEAPEEAGAAPAPDQVEDRADAEGDGDKVPEEAAPAAASSVPEVAPETPKEVKAQLGDSAVAPDEEKVSAEPVADLGPADVSASSELKAEDPAEVPVGSNAEAFFSPTAAATAADNAGAGAGMPPPEAAAAPASSVEGADADENSQQIGDAPAAEPAGGGAIAFLSPAQSPTEAAAVAELLPEPPQEQQERLLQQQQEPMLAVDGSVERVEVPDTEMRGEFRGAQAPDPMATAERLKGAVAGVIAEFGSGLMDLPDGELRTALVEWKSKLEYHVLELQDIVQSKLPSPSMAQAASQAAAPPMEAEPTPIAGSGAGIVGLRDFESQLPSFEHGLADPGRPPPPQAISPSIGAASSAEPFEATRVSDSGLVGDLAHVRNIGRQLESHRTGKDLKEVVSAWEDPDDVAREMADLKRVRRQIRYLFGGMLGTMQEFSPADAQLRVDDLLGDKGDEPALNIATPAPPRQPGDILGKPPPGILDPRQASPAPGRPRSGHTDLSSVSSSNLTWDSQRAPEKGAAGDDSERRKEKKERRHRHHRHRQVSADPEWGRVRQESPSFAGKRDDGAPPKNWNWAEEVMKASLDPDNQWDFHNPPRMPADDGNRRSNSTRPPLARGVVPVWEKPRTPGAIRRGDEVASKARERAEELLRNERERHKQLLSYDQPGAHRSFR